MDLSKLFEMQRKLDEHIIKEKGLEGQYLLPRNILALQVELGELANAWRGFKYWSKRQFPTDEEIHSIDNEGNVYKRNNMLEEYVDALHFMLSIGNDLNFEYYSQRIQPQKSLIDAFLDVFGLTNSLDFKNATEEEYNIAFERFIELGEMLGFTWEEVEQAYIAKNAVNHERQENGY